MLSRTRGARPPQGATCTGRLCQPRPPQANQKQRTGNGWWRAACALLGVNPRRPAWRAPRPSQRARARCRRSPSASRLAHEAAPTGRGLQARAAVAAVAASVQLDGAAVVLAVLALLLRGAHEAAQKVPWKQRRVRAAPPGARGGPAPPRPTWSPRGPPDSREALRAVGGTRLGHPENPEEVSLNGVADNGGKQREGRSPRQVPHGHVAPRRGHVQRVLPQLTLPCHS